jgi:hypothetical protein
VSETAGACQAIGEDLSALIDEELAPEREAELRAHLETCDRCARRLEELCNVDLVLASLPAPEVGSDLRVQLAGRIAEHERREALSAASVRREGRLRQAPPPRRRRWLGRRVAALAAVAAAVALAVFATLRGGETPVPGAPQIARPAPQALPAQGPAPRAEQRGEPLLAERRSVEPEPALLEPARPTQPEARPVEIAETPPAVGLGNLAEEDLAMLLVLDAVEDLDVIANLELLEDLLELEAMEGAG